MRCNVCCCRAVLSQRQLYSTTTQDSTCFPRKVATFTETAHSRLPCGVTEQEYCFKISTGTLHYAATDFCGSHANLLAEMILTAGKT